MAIRNEKLNSPIAWYNIFADNSISLKTDGLIDWLNTRMIWWNVWYVRCTCILHCCFHSHQWHSIKDNTFLCSENTKFNEIDWPQMMETMWIVKRFQFIYIFWLTLTSNHISSIQFYQANIFPLNNCFRTFSFEHSLLRNPLVSLLMRYNVWDTYWMKNLLCIARSHQSVIEKSKVCVK